jgi:hypothetical protein
VEYFLSLAPISQAFFTVMTALPLFFSSTKLLLGFRKVRNHFFLAVSIYCVTAQKIDNKIAFVIEPILAGPRNFTVVRIEEPLGYKGKLSEDRAMPPVLILA